jgi:hypothetical protein
MTPLEEKELLLRVVTKLAQTQLEQGGFIPFGAVLGSKRDLKLLRPKSWKQNPTRDDVEGYWFRELKKHAEKEGCRSLCFCADVWIPTEGDQLLPAILVHIEHVESDAEEMLYPYGKDEGSRVVFGKRTSETVERRVFVDKPAQEGR